MNKLLRFALPIFLAFMALGLAGWGLRAAAQAPLAFPDAPPADGGAGFAVGGKTFAAAPVNPSAPAPYTLGSSITSHAAAPSGQQQPPFFVAQKAAQPKAPTEGLNGMQAAAALHGLMPNALPGVTFNIDLNAVFGQLNPGDTVYITATGDGGSGFATAVADAAGVFWSPMWGDTGAPYELNGDDTVHIWVNGGDWGTFTLQNISGAVNVLNDTVSGVVENTGSGTAVWVELGARGLLMGAHAPQMSVNTGSGGAFAAAFAQDVTPLNFAAVTYQVAPQVYALSVLRPQNFAVENFNTYVGYAEPGSSVDVTVYNVYPTDIRWQGSGGADVGYGFYNIIGLNTASPGNVVEVALNGGAPMQTTLIDLHDTTFDSAGTVSGFAPQGSTVAVNFWAWTAADGAAYYGDSTAAGAGDAFSVSGLQPFDPRDAVSVLVSDAQGNATALYGGAPFLQALLNLDDGGMDCLNGRGTASDEPVTVWIETADGVYTRTNPTNPTDPGNNFPAAGYCYLIWGPGWGPIDFQPGDVLHARAGDWHAQMTIPAVDWTSDTANDHINGSAPDGELLLMLAQPYSAGAPDWSGAQRLVDVNAGTFDADFSGFDLQNGQNVGWKAFDTNGYAAEVVNAGATHFFQVHLPWGVWIDSEHAGEYIVASLYDELGNFLEDADGYADEYGLWLAGFESNEFLPGRYVTVTSDAGWTSGMQLPPLSVNVDLNANTFSGDGPATPLFLENSWSDARFIGSNNGYLFDALATTGAPIDWGSAIDITHFAPSGDRATAHTFYPHLFTAYGNRGERDTVWGYGVTPNSLFPITVTTQSGDYITSSMVQANIFGDYNWFGLPAGAISPVNRVQAAFPNSPFALETLEVLPISVQANPNTDVFTVTAPVGMGFYARIESNHGYWDWSQHSNEPPNIGASGYYTFNTSQVGFDILPGDSFYVNTIQELGHSTYYDYWLPGLNIAVNEDHNWVESHGSIEPGHSIAITVTNASGAIKATAQGETGEIPWWGQSGFSTNHNVLWSNRPDLQVNDWVYVRMDDDLYAEVQIGEIDLNVDVVGDIVNGTFHVPWFTGDLNGDCGIWQDGGPGMGFVAGADGGAFTCDFSSLWDILPGQMIGVAYHEPDGDHVIHVAPNPAPRFRLDLWSNGAPTPGNNYEIFLEYRNEGDAAAEDATISVTLHSGFTYLGDTSGFPVSGSGAPGDPLIWHVGDTPADNNLSTRFSLFLTVQAAPGELTSLFARIQNGTPYHQDNPWDAERYWENLAIENDTSLNIGKNAWTHNVTAGGEVIYSLNVCNNGASNSAPVLVTDTLPMSATLLDWWSQYPGWQEITAQDHLLVVERPVMPGYWCSEVYVRAQIDENAWYGMELHNTAYVFSNSDLSDDDNQSDFYHWVDVAHANLRVNLRWNWGSLTPGSEIRYNNEVINDGNVIAANVRVTNTLPTNTEFIAAYWYDQNGAHPFPPAQINGNQVVWEIADLPNGYNINFETVLRITDTAQIGDILKNTLEISSLPDEIRPEDNLSIWSEQIYGHGPNLRVRLEADWHGHGEGHNAWYNAILENVGDTYAYHVNITNTLPAGWQLEGDPNTDWGSVEDYVRNDAEGWYRLTFRELHPNWRRDIRVDVVNPDANPVPGGLLFTFAAHAETLENDPTPEDNTAEISLGSGPDLYAQYTRVEGALLPGELVTLTVRVGNQQVGHAWWWNPQSTPIFTTTLPAASEYITSAWHFCGETDWCLFEPSSITGNNLRWEFDFPLSNGNWNEVRIVARLPQSLTGLDTLESLAEITASDPLLDAEYDYANNAAAFSSPVNLPFLTVSKTAQTSAVAGTLITYTLTVNNTGFGDATGIELSDPLPTGVTYGGGGTLNGSTIQWDVLKIGGITGTAQAQFWGTLTCQTGAVVNQGYAVTGSDQNILSEMGAPLTVTVAAPDMAATAEASALTALTGETLTFTGTGTTNGSALTYAWDFDDGSTASTAQASHAFAQPGEYHVTLTVTDACGYSAETTLTVVVQSAGGKIYLPLILRNFTP